MNRVFAVLFACASFNTGSADSIAHTVAGQASAFVIATLFESFKGDHSLFGQAMDKQRPKPTTGRVRRDSRP